MRLKTRTWIGLCIALAVSVLLVWQLALPRRAGNGEQANAPQPFELRITNATASAAAGQSKAATVATRFASVATNVPNAPFNNPLAHRLTNSTQPLEKMLRSDTAVLLRNALIDTTRGAPAVPAHLRANGDPGAYIVQARGVITDAFRAELKRAGAEVVSYVPNNAYLVRGSALTMADVRRSGLVQSVLPFEPYYKLDPRLLNVAVKGELSPFGLLNVVTFPGTSGGARDALQRLGAVVVGQAEPTPFGEVLVIKAPADRIADVAQVTEVQMLGVHREKRLLNDLTRPLLKISTNIANSTNIPIVRPPESHYINDVTGKNLTGDGVLVAVVDSGIDAAHPDLTGRIVLGPGAGPDYDGHGTHVTATLIGDGAASPLTGTNNAQGSLSNAVFSGMAPKARAFVMHYDLPDFVLQENTASNRVLISNNSWGRPGLNDYDIHAASYDAAVRDSRPGVTGEQEVLYVFAAGNEGGGGENGLNGIPGSIVSPATAKNVITVGGSDLPRFISNAVATACKDVEVVSGGVTNIVRVCETNRPWWGMTETNNQVSTYSSRGNVGIGFEGPFGRFKPDVVAPGSMLVSARSQHYTDVSGSTNVEPFTYNNLSVGFNATNLYALTIPANAISVTVLALTNSLSPTNMTLDVAANVDVIPPPGLTGVNTVTLDGTTSPALTAGTLYYTIANNTHSNTTVNFDLVVLLTTTNDLGDYFDVLKQLNEPLKPNYRYESGTSMAAPAISGFLALLQEFLGTNNVQASPALLKAMLINGARSLSPNYNLQVSAPVNHQGWGIANMSNSIPSGFNVLGSNGPMRIFDRRLTNALATGGTEVYEVSVPEEARSYPLRVTLVWTDPPGNPVTGVKLVNDMNLSVLGASTNSFATSTNTGVTNGASLLWLGNSFPPGSDFTEPLIVSTSNTNLSAVTNLTEVIDATRDYVNNVENIYIRPPLSSRYTVVVKAHRVNVNAVNSHPESHVQDYALVISSGNVAPTNLVNLAVSGPTFTNDPSPRLSPLIAAPRDTNNPNASARAGLIDQRVGANNPLIVSTNGGTNQWAFFTYTNVNDSTYTNVVIAAFLAPNLSLPRLRDADIDLYVARGPAGAGLFQLDPAVISSSTRSVQRGGTEILTFNNAGNGEVFSIGVKSEDQQAANFSIYVESRNTPFSNRDASNNIIASAIGPIIIPDGTPEDPGGTNMFLFVLDPRDSQETISRIYVTNSIYHEEAGDIIGILSRPGGTNAVALNNHRTWNGWETVVYRDPDDVDLDDGTSPLDVIVPDGPGRLRDFIGEQAGPAWTFNISDNALFHTGFVQEVTLVIEPAATNNPDANVVIDRVICLAPGAWRYLAFDVPADVFNVEICLSEFNPLGAGPIAVYVRRGGFPDFGAFDYLFSAAEPATCFNIGLGDNPPLLPGRYYIGLYNSNITETVCFRTRVTLERNLVPAPHVTYVSADTPKLLNSTDNAKTNSFIFVPDHGRIEDLRVGLRVEHERASDLAFHLVSPAGTRVLLMENRGRTNKLGIGAAGMGISTNIGATVVNEGFDLARGTDGGARPAYGTGERFSGWTVASGDVDVVHHSYGLLTNAHTGTNAVDLNGTSGGGSIVTNFTTKAGQAYTLEFAFCKNPSPSLGSATAAADINGAQLVSFSYNFANDYWNPAWRSTSVVFQATSTNTALRFRQVNPPGGDGGMFVDSVVVREVSFSTNLYLYTTFTEDTNLTLTPIKFGNPPFTNSPNPKSPFVLNDGFEYLSSLILTSAQVFRLGVPAGAPGYNTDISGWHVDKSDVGVHSLEFGPDNFPESGTYFVDINGYLNGKISTNITTEVGEQYELRFAHRKTADTNFPSPARAILELQGASTLANVSLTITNVGGWAFTSFTFTADSPVTKLSFEGNQPPDSNQITGVFIDTVTVQKISPNPSVDSGYFLPEESMKPIFGQDAFGWWRLEVWDSRLGAVLSNGVLVSWRLEIAYPQTNPPVLTLTNGQSISTNLGPDEVFYFSVPVECASGLITNTLQNTTGPGATGLDLIFNQFVLPTNGPNDSVLLTGVTGTERAVLTIGSPPLVIGGRYYLAVRNTTPGTSNTFTLTIDASTCTPTGLPVVTTNELCNVTNAPSPSVQTFLYTMPANVVQARFETYNASGDVDLAVRYGGPPGPGSLASRTPGTGNEVVLTSTSSTVDPVQPGTWFLAVSNATNVEVGYCIKVTEYFPTRIALNTPTTFTQLAGETRSFVVYVDANYCEISFDATNSVPSSALDIFVGDRFIPSTNSFDYFGVADPVGVPPVAITQSVTNRVRDWFITVVNTNNTSVTFDLIASASPGTCFVGPVIVPKGAGYGSNGFTLAWQADPATRYQVQFTDTLSPPNWQSFSGVVSSATSNFEFTDSGAVTNVQRFYRILLVP